MDQAALNKLVRNGRLRAVKPSGVMGRRLWAKAEKDMSTAKHLVPVDADRAHECAYDAIFKAVYSILRCVGHRIAPVKQRVTGVDALRAILDDPAYASLIDAFDDMREKRNLVSYEAGETTETEAKEAIATAEKVLALLAPTYKTFVAGAP